MRISILLILFSLCLTTVSAQRQIPIGKWKSYLPFTRGGWVSQSETHTYYASDFGLVAIHKEDFTPRFYTKTEGLNDVEASLVAYNRLTDQLLLTYKNSNMDILDANGIHNLNDILENNTIIGEKTIHQIEFEADRFAFLCTAFGLVQINLANITFGFTTFTDEQVFDFAWADDRYYISTSEGIYYAPASPSFNHNDFSSWQKAAGNFGLAETYSSTAISEFRGRVYADIDGDLYRLEEGGSTMLYTDDAYDIQYLSSSPHHLLAGLNCRGGGQCPNDRLLLLDENEVQSQQDNGCVFNTMYAIEDEQGRFYYADESPQYRYADGVEGASGGLLFESPLSSTASDFAFDGDVVYMASGGVSPDFFYTFNQAGLQIYDKGEWDFRNESNVAALADPEMLDFYKILLHPVDGRIYLGTFWGGLVIWDREDGYEIFNEENSCLKRFRPENLRERIAGMAFDDQYNLWISNHGSETPLVAFDTEGNCYNFSVSSWRGLGDMVIDRNGYKWILVSDLGAGLIVYDEGDLIDPGDDQYKVITTGNSELPTNQTNSIGRDLDGDIWVGTEEGVVVFECPSSIFSDEGCSGTRRKVDVGGNIAFLLENENVTAIAIDGANRKWFGSRNGIFVQSSSGEDEVLRFHTANSPLPSNDIRAMDINPESGEVFIATAKGVVSYRADATLGEDFFHKQEVFAFPNPVRPGYDGPIAIQGLPRDATVKITDISGRLMYETKANGGEAIWYGRDYTGRKAASGVYLVFSSSTDAFDKPDALVTKILFVR